MSVVSIGEANGATMGLGDLLRKGETDAGAAGFGGVEGRQPTIAYLMEY